MAETAKPSMNSAFRASTIPGGVPDPEKQSVPFQDPQFTATDDFSFFESLGHMVELLLILLIKPDQFELYASAYGLSSLDSGGKAMENWNAQGTVSVRRAPAGDLSAIDSGPFELSDSFPEDANFTHAYQEGLNRIYVGQDKDGNEVTVIKARDTSKDGTRSWANNNPGNLMYSDWEKEFGAIGKDDDGFAIFKNLRAGLDTQAELLRRNYSHLTLSEAMYKYAPPSENNTEAYIATLVKETGIDRNTRLQDLTSGQMQKLIQSIIKHEEFKEGKILINGKEQIEGKNILPEDDNMRTSEVSSAFKTAVNATGNVADEAVIPAYIINPSTPGLKPGNG